MRGAIFDSVRAVGFERGIRTATGAVAVKRYVASREEVDVAVRGESAQHRYVMRVVSVDMQEVACASRETIDCNGSGGGGEHLDIC